MNTYMIYSFARGYNNDFCCSTLLHFCHLLHPDNVFSQNNFRTYQVPLSLYNSSRTIFFLFLSNILFLRTNIKKKIAKFTSFPRLKWKGRKSRFAAIHQTLISKRILYSKLRYFFLAFYCNLYSVIA